jgi:dTDP-4-amino-4,6-dideoxygalactose transaminase
MDPKALEAAIEGKRDGIPRAIVPVHLYGNPADLHAITAIARRHNLYLIEDCAQSHGATLEDRATGSWGNIASFSFYPTKNLGAFGDGGMVVTNDDNLAERVRLLRQYGWKDRYISEIAGSNSRLDELHAATLRVKLRHLHSDNQRRRYIAKKYCELLAECDLTLPVERDRVIHAYHQFVVRHPERDAFRMQLEQDKISTLIHYAVPVHMQPAYRGRIPIGESLFETERAVGEIVSLPMYPQLSDAQVDRVCQSVRRVSRRR